MAIVINLGTTISVTNVIAKDNKILVKDYDEITVDSQYLNDFDSLEKALKYFIDLKKLMNEKVYITLSYGSGIQYRTSTIAVDDMATDMFKKAEEKENHVLDMALKVMPEGLEDISSSWEVVINNAYEYDANYILTCAYVPTVVIENIKKLAEQYQLNVFYIGSITYGLYKLFDLSQHQLITEIPTGLIAMNEFGMCCWARPAVSTLSKNQEIDNIIKTSHNIFPITENMPNKLINISEFDEYVVIPYESECPLTVFSYTAIGLMSAVNNVKRQNTDTASEVAEGGGIKSVTDKIRKLFKKQ